MKLIIILLPIILALSSCNPDPHFPEKSDQRQETQITELPPVTAQVPEPPQVPAQTAPVEEILAQAQTQLLDASAPRVQNISLACDAINGTVLEPGESFSFNDAVGHRTEENGYTDAPVIVNGHSEQGCGGGVCQVSTTLYMAAADSGMTIDEHHTHSKSVPYASEGRDATVVFGEKDLKFTNETDTPVTVYVWTDGSDVFSKITKKSP